MSDQKLLSSPTKPGVRRLSSFNTTFEELALGPSVVVPPEHMAKPSDAHETAAAMEMAKYRLAEKEKKSPTDGQITPPPTPPQTNFTDEYAFAFDIDGVLVRGGKPIPQAVEAMKVLNGQNEFGVKVYVVSPVAYLPALTSQSDPTSSSPTAVERRSKKGVWILADSWRWKFPQA